MAKPKAKETKKVDWKKAYIEMRRIASHALDLADRCHGGHSYTTLRSTAAKVCCEVRLQIHEMREEYVKVSGPIET